jgi:hypothetical protein
MQQVTDELFTLGSTNSQRRTIEMNDILTDPLLRWWAAGVAAVSMLFVSAVSACTSEAQRDGSRRPAPMNRFEWLASNSAPQGTPMRVVRGAFVFPEGGSLYIPPAKLNNGWGQRGSVHVVGNDLKPLPDRVEITFYSYLEDRFYRGTFPLPRDEIARLFVEGFRSFRPDAEWETYRSIVAGVAPGGAVAIWVSGSERQVEVFYGHADAVELDWHTTLGFPAHVDRRELIAQTLAESAKRDTLVTQMMQRIPFGIWDAYRRPYRWRPVFEGMDTPATLRRLFYFNGERDNLELPADWADRPVPAFLIFMNPQTRWSYHLTFDEQETLAAFEQVGREGRPVELVFRTATYEGRPSFHVLVRSDEEDVELTRVKVEFYRAN